MKTFREFKAGLEIEQISEDTNIPITHATDAVGKVLGQKGAVNFLAKLKPGNRMHTSWNEINGALIDQGVQSAHIAKVAGHLKPNQYNESEENQDMGKLMQVNLSRDKGTGKVKSISSEYKHPHGGYWSHTVPVTDEDLHNHISHLSNAVHSGIYAGYNHPNGRQVKITPDNLNQVVNDIKGAHHGKLPSEYSAHNASVQNAISAEKTRHANMSQSEKDRIERNARGYGQNRNMGD